jgi:diguanylate cyclase (GGDEF)-like protein
MSISKKGYSLVFIISVLVMSSVLLTVSISVYSAYQVSRSSLIASYLDNNKQYAEKLALNTNDLFTTMQASIKAIADVVGHGSNLNQELNDLYGGNKQYFNSIFVANENRIIQARSSREMENVIGQQLTSETSMQAIRMKQPFISEPYRGLTGKYVILISSPIYDVSGNYKGFVGGTIYLEETNSLNRILNEHFFLNGSYVFVVDKTGDLIFHPDKNRLGESVIKNKMVHLALSGQSGSMKVLNTINLPFYAGYSYLSSSGWGIVSQTPTSVINKPLAELLQRMILQSLPFLLLVLLIGCLVAVRITKPLNRLSKFSEETFLNKSFHNHNKVPEIKSNIYEVRQLYQSAKTGFQQIHNHLNDLRIEIETDGLTGIANRKSFDLVLEKLINSQTPFSLILLDIDHFKSVNDTYGHLIGDDVLQYLAKIMLDLSREEDLCFRYGGEEFGVIVKSGDTELAKNVAERLRTTVEKLQSPTGKHITISLGVATYPKHEKEVKQLISNADKALYESKVKGRNRTTILNV